MWTKESILLAVALHSEGFEFLLLIGGYRGIVEEFVFPDDRYRKVPRAGL